MAGWIEHRIKEKRDLTLDELVAELRCGHGVGAHPVPVWRQPVFARHLAGCQSADGGQQVQK